MRSVLVGLGRLWVCTSQSCTQFPAEVSRIPSALGHWILVATVRWICEGKGRIQGDVPIIARGGQDEEGKIGDDIRSRYRILSAIAWEAVWYSAKKTKNEYNKNSSTVRVAVGIAWL